MKYDVNTAPELKDSDKPIEVTDNVTPITQQPVQDVRPDLWYSDNVSLEFLNSQMSILQKRLTYAQSLHQPHMIQSIQQGIATLEKAISHNLERENC